VTNLWVIHYDPSDFKKDAVAVWNDAGHHYEPVDETNAYCLTPDTTPALMDHINGIVGQVEKALPQVLAYTNQIAATLSNVTQISSNVNAEILRLQPILSNAEFVTANMRDTNGGLGNMLIPPALKEQLVGTLSGTRATMTNVNVTLDDVNNRLPSMLLGVDLVLSNTANITSNLNNQVVANSNMLTSISEMVVHSDQMVEGLKHHWLLRSAFKTPKTNSPAKGK
jgi:methyl-accepting chemotaxis protein